MPNSVLVEKENQYCQTMMTCHCHAAGTAWGLPKDRGKSHCSQLYLQHAELPPAILHCIIAMVAFPASQLQLKAMNAQQCLRRRASITAQRNS
jgi:hypothetical protein